MNGAYSCGRIPDLRFSKLTFRRMLRTGMLCLRFNVSQSDCLQLQKSACASGKFATDSDRPTNSQTVEELIQFI